MQTVVETVLALATFYLLIGLSVAVGLHLVGLKRIDPAVDGAGWFFRLLITPGLVAFWPLLLQRWRLSPAGPQPGQVHRPLAASGLRALHRRLTVLLFMVVPILAAAGVLLRPARPVTEKNNVFAEQAALPQLLAGVEQPFGDLPIRLALRAGEGDPRQLELEVGRDLELPNLLIYWTPDEAAFPDGSVYLGAVWGPGTRRYAIDRELVDRGGSFVLYTLTHQRIVASAPVPRG